MKQAVVLIHGIGEQYPMETIKSFVETMWVEHTELHAKHPNASKYFVAPDDHSDNFDLRRIITSKNKYGVQTDFYEYYWAHLMKGNKMTHIYKWLTRILHPNPFRLPAPINWASTILIFIVVGIMALLFWVNNILHIDDSLFTFLKILMIPILISMIIGLLESYVGDAARYLDPSPSNVHVRQMIRKQGVELLEKLKKNGYEKVILVGHSLGSVIAYDIVRYAWASADLSYEKGTRLIALKDVVDHLDGSEKCADLEEYQQRQWKAFREQKKEIGNWLVSDLITIGSPLTYSQMLLAKNAKAFDKLKEDREILTSPPELDKKGLTYSSKSEGKRKMINSAAFALTRWTNIYSASKFLIFGDIISGPLKKLFGETINDINVNENGKLKLLTHTKYWSKGESARKIETIRKALKLDELKSEKYLNSDEYLAGNNNKG